LGEYGKRPKGRRFEPRFLRERLMEPDKLRKASQIFAVSMGDLWSEGVEPGWVDKVFAAMSICQRHTFLTLTKRPNRMLEWFSEEWQTPEGGREYRCDQVGEEAFTMSDSENAEHWTEDGHIIAINQWPLANVWLGTSVTDQQDADERIPQLLSTPAAHRWLSVEPLLGPVDLHRYMPLLGERCPDGATCHHGCVNECWRPNHGCVWLSKPDPFIDWVVVGAQTGPGAVKPQREWVAGIVNQCKAAGVPVFLKSNLASVWGEELIQEYPKGLEAQP